MNKRDNEKVTVSSQRMDSEIFGTEDSSFQSTIQNWFLIFPESMVQPYEHKGR